MTEKFDNKNYSESLDREASINDNYAANLDEDGQDVYEASKGHKQLKFWFFLMFVVFLIIITSSRFYDNIFGPLKYETPAWITEQLDAEEQAAKTIAELKQSDTDQDGLTDYQEIYQYYTSMFLPDTDSDGFTDAEEVNLGEDPLCPIGQSCNLLRLITPNTKLASIVEGVALDSELTLQKAAASEFRLFLESNGMPKEELDSLSDEDLLAIFKIAEESNIFDATQLNASTTPAEIRNFLLLLPGIDVEEINAMTDEELMGVADGLLSK